MKKIFLSIMATAIMSSMTVYAGGGKKQSHKQATKKEVCGKDCPATKDCPKTGKCPTRPGCVCG